MTLLHRSSALLLGLAFTTATPDLARADGTLDVHPSGSTSSPYGYVAYTPPGYDASAGLYPLVVVLHGQGELGDGSSPLGPVTANGPLRSIADALARGSVPSFGSRGVVVVRPQAPVWWNVDTLDAFFDFVARTYRVDPDRVYLTGLSMGGGGTWDYASAHPDRLAAIVPVCGASWGDVPRARALVGMPIWAFHALDDHRVGVGNTNAWMDALAVAYGAAADVDVYATYPWSTTVHQTMRLDTGTATASWSPGTVIGAADRVGFTAYIDGDHFIWGRAYDQPETWDWLFAQNRGGPVAVDAGMPDAGGEMPDGGEADASAGAADAGPGAADAASAPGDAGVVGDAGRAAGDAAVPRPDASGDGGASRLDSGDQRLVGSMSCSAGATHARGVPALVLAMLVPLLRRRRARPVK